MGAEGTLVPEADEAHNPATNQDSEQPGRVRHGPKHPNWKRDQFHRLDAFREGRPQVGELSGGAVETL